MRYRLRRPITVAGKKVVRLHITAPDDATCAALLAEPDDARRITKALTALTGLDDVAVRQIDLEDGIEMLDRFREVIVGDA